jgi:hypothetical protein
MMRAGRDVIEGAYDLIGNEGSNERATINKGG